MNRIVSHNKTNKENIAKAIVLIYDYNNNVSDYLKKILLDRLLWATTEHDNNGDYKKYLGQPYWSIGAIRKLLDNMANKRNLFLDLRHEHAVPKKEIKHKILDLETKSYDNIISILDDLGHAVVVSKEEDGLLNKAGYRSKMPIKLSKNPGIEEVFSRYREAGIKVCNIANMDIRTMNLDDLNNIEKKIIN